MRAPRRSLVVATFVAVAVAWPTGASWAAPPPVVVSDGPYEATPSDDGSTLKVTVTNLAEDDVSATLEGADGVDCSTGKAEKVAAGRSRSVSFAIPSSCLTEDDAADLVLVIAGGADAQIALDGVSIDADPDPDFTPLSLYLVALALSALLVGSRAGDVDWKWGWGRELPGLPDDWSFADSWATNAGAAAAVFTGLFAATDVLEALLAEDAAEVVLAVVAAALTAGLIGAGPVVLGIFRGSGSNGSNLNTDFGVCLASTLVLSANLGLIWVMTHVLWGASEIPWQLVLLVSVSASLLIAAYAWTSVPRTISVGRTPSGQEAAKAKVAAALTAEVSRRNISAPDDIVACATDVFITAPYLATSPGDEVRPRVSAML